MRYPAFLLLLCLPTFAYAAPDYQALQTVSVRVDVGQGCGSGVLVTRQVGDVTRTYVWTAGHVAEVLRKMDGTFGEATIYQEIRENGKLIGKRKVSGEGRLLQRSGFGRGLGVAGDQQGQLCRAVGLGDL